MDKNAIKKFAIWARKELIARVTQRAYLYGIDGEQILDAEQKEVNGRLLSAVELKQRRTLVNRVKEKGFESVVDEAAYTWFNRFTALRYMEVNGILPTRVRVFTDSEGTFHPQILEECLTMDNLEGLNKEIVFAFNEQNKTDELYKYLLITQCNALGTILPAMFEQIEDYTELLLPDNLLRQGSVIEQMVTSIPEDDWRDAVQIIGWLYQYYNSEPKDAVFAALKKNVKVSKENIPAATQLFTPDWIVRYMVENSLGRIWIEHNEANRTTGMILNSHTLLNSKATLNGKAGDEPRQYEKEFAEKMGWKYYLPEAKQEPEVAAELKKLRAERKDLAPTDIKVIDPCMGSGHILVYAFDVLVQIYKDAGYSERSIPELILQNNLYGLDIDDRAYQLAYFAVMMRAWHYNHRILRKHIEPHLCAIQESNGLSKWSDDATDMSGNQLTLDEQFIELADDLIDTFQDAKEYGSILTVKEENYDGLLDYIEEIQQHGASDLAVSAWIGEIADKLPALIKQAKIMSGKYDVCVTNPPYRGVSDVSENLRSYLKTEYPFSCSDLSTVFMDYGLDIIRNQGYLSMINIPVWLSLASYTKLRKKIIDNFSIINLLHLGRGVFGSDYGTVSFIISSTHQDNYYGFYKKFFHRLSLVTSVEDKKDIFFGKTRDYKANQSLYKKLPNYLIAYAANSIFVKAFTEHKELNHFATIFEGLKTRNKDKFVRLWHEISSPVWKPYAKGGNFRRWYGNDDYVVKWGEDGSEIRNYKKSSGANFQYYNNETITYNAMTMSPFTGRYIKNQLFGGGGGGITNSKHILSILAFVNSVVFNYIISPMKSTVNFEVGQIGNIPFLLPDNHTIITRLAAKNINISATDWNNFEISQNFKVLPIIPAEYNKKSITINSCYHSYQSTCEQRFQSLKSNEEELNKIFITIYGLQDELSSDVNDRDVTVARIYDSKDDIPDSMKGNNYVLTKSDVVKSLLSYAVGCMFGRYSLDVPGLAYAGGEFDWSKYPTFRPDEDDIIPICDDEYFEDDIVDRFCTWLRTVYGEAHYQENLQFISDALGGKGSPLENIRSYFLNDFYKDHCKTYKKRPIYWLFDAGKKNSFKALVYIHRYDRDTMARMRTGYVYKQQELYKTRIETYKKRVDTAASQADKNKYKKELKRLQDQFDEIHAYEEKIHHYADLRQEIDLDDGVKHNYALFADVLAKIK